MEDCEVTALDLTVRPWPHVVDGKFGQQGRHWDHHSFSDQNAGGGADSLQRDLEDNSTSADKATGISAGRT